MIRLNDDFNIKSMNTNFSQSNSVEVFPSTSLTLTNSISQSSHSTNFTRTINNNNNNNNTHNSDNDNQTTTTTTKPSRIFSCTVCNVDLSNQKHFNSHLNSRQHQQAQSIHDLLQSVAPDYRPAYKAMFSPDMLNKKVFNRRLHCEEALHQTKKSLLGLNHIIEFQFENLTDSPQYICELCHRKFSYESLVSHLLDIQHQKKFLKMNHPDMYERVLSASNIRSEQQRLIENYARQIQSRHGGPGNVQLHIQLDSFVGQKPVVLSVNFKSQQGQNLKGYKKKPLLQLMTKTFQDYDYEYEKLSNKVKEECTSQPIVNNHEDSVQRGLSPEDLLYPFDRQFWYRNYKDLLGSRPIDPHSVTYEEIIPESNNIQPFQRISQTPSHTSPVSTIANDNHLTLENGQTIRRNASQPSNRRVILDTNRTPTLTQNGVVKLFPSQNVSNFDGYTLLNAQQKKTDNTNPVLNEQSARAILAASGLLQPDEEDGHDRARSNQSSTTTKEESKTNSDQIVSPLIAKRMLDAVLNGELDVIHIQPYFSTFVNLIQSGQVELERHQAERLLHKVLVTSSTSMNKTEPVINSNKRARSTSNTLECHSSSISRHHQYEDYKSSKESNPAEYSSSTLTARQVHLANDNRMMNGKRSYD